MLAVLATLVASAAVDAGSLQVTPVGFDLTPPAAASTLTVRNNGNAATWLQVRAFEWTQHGGEDVLGETAQLVVTPPVAQVTPGHEQLFRLVVADTGAGDSLRQRNYRLLIDELPDEPISEGRSVRVLLRYSLPVSVTPPGLDAARLVATLEQGAVPALVVGNDGGRRASLANVRLVVGGETVRVLENGGLLGHVLPGSIRRWPIDLDGMPAGAAQLHLMLDGQPHALPVRRP